MTLTQLIGRYAAFAAIATLANLLVQRLILSGGDELARFIIAVGCGTLAGLVVKFVLDKKWIFQDVGTGLKDHSKKFTLYTTVGLLTTAIFWGAETAFWLIWKTTTMRECGALLGLACGYVIKFQLDRRWVFTDAQLRIRRAA